MKKPLFILTLAAAVSPMLDAKVYSCGPGCYSDKAKGSKGYANLGKQLGSYSVVKPKTAEDTPAVAATAPEVKPDNLAARTRPARPVAVKRSKTPYAAAVPAVAVSRPKAVPMKTGGSGRRTILEQELNNERNALANAQKALAEGRVVVGGKSDAEHQSRVRRLESAVLDRQQNIQALQRELSRM